MNFAHRIRRPSWLAVTVAVVVLLVLAATVAPTRAWALERIYVVRHAETVEGWPHEGDLDRYRPLDAAGTARAQRWAERLADAGIAAVYASPTTRALATGFPLARQQQCPLVASEDTIDRSKITAFLQALRIRHATDVAVLIVGHSNTVPWILAAAGADELCFEHLGVFADATYDWLVKGYDGLWILEADASSCEDILRESAP
jgi:phosphohistidine phosphatase SixA